MSVDARADRPAAVSVPAAIALVAAWIAGAWLRLWDLGGQVVMGDELHALRSALEGTPRTIIREYGLPDVSIPLALWNHALLGTLGLDEWGLRAPVVVTGLLMLPLISLFVRRRFGELEGVAVAWLVAVSPLLLKSSRFARPYLPAAFLLLVAVVLWHGAAKRGRAGSWLAALTGLLAVAFTPTAAPAVLVGLVLIAVHGWRRRATRPGPDRRRTSSVVLVAVGVLVLAALALPKLASLSSLILRIQSRTLEQPVAWRELGEIAFGVSSLPLLLWLLGTAIVGWAVCWRRARGLAVVIAVLVVTQLAAVLILVPWTNKPSAIARYTLVVLPLLLVATSCGLAAQVRLLLRLLVGERRLAPTAEVALVAAALAGLVVAGPVPETYSPANSFTSAWPDHQAPRDVPLQPPWPPFYDFLAASDGDLVIAEGPELTLWLSPYPRYQGRHRQRVRLLSHGGLLRHPDLHLASVVRREGDLFDTHGVDYVILHHNVLVERIGIARYGREITTRHFEPWVWKKEELLVQRAAGAIEVCHRDPQLSVAYEDGWIIVFARGQPALDAVRAWERERAAPPDAEPADR